MSSSHRKSNKRRSHTRSRSYSKSLSRSRSRSRSRDEHRKPWFQHDNRVEKHEEEDKLKWWRAIESQKADNHAHHYDHDHSYPSKKQKLGSTEVVNDCIVNNAIYNRRMDAMQKRYAENKLIAMGVNPFINKNVVLMTDHLNTSKTNAIRGIDESHKRNYESQYNHHKHSSLFKSKHKPRKKPNDKLDFSFHPAAVHDDEEENQCDHDLKQADLPTDYTNWLHHDTAAKDKKEHNQINVEDNSLFNSVFDDDNDEDSS